MERIAIQRLLEEAVIAISFYRRSIFYSSSKIETGKLLAPCTYDDFVDTLQVADMGLRDPLLKQSTENDVCKNFSRKINEIYRASIELLSERYFLVAKEYKTRRCDISNRNIRIADRDRMCDADDAAHMMLECHRVLKRIAHRLRCSVSILSAPCENYLNEWNYVRECGKNFMDEISFLSKRIDDFNGFISAAESRDSDKASLARADEAIRKADQANVLADGAAKTANRMLAIAGATLLATILIASANFYFSKESQHVRDGYDKTIIDIRNRLESLTQTLSNILRTPQNPILDEGADKSPVVQGLPGNPQPGGGLESGSPQ